MKSAVTSTGQNSNVDCKSSRSKDRSGDDRSEFPRSDSSCAASVRSREAHQVSLRDSQLATSGSKPHWHYYEDLGGLYTQRGVT